MPSIPRDTGFDGTLALIRDPYGFVSGRCRRHGSDLFETRLLLRKTVCMTGPEAAELFYDESRFVRRGAAPGRIRNTLFGRGGVQGLDDTAHRHRKRMLMSLMTPESVGNLAEITAGWWRTYGSKWAAMDRMVLYDEVRELFTRAACEWAGVPLDGAEVGLRTRQLTALFDGADTVGPKRWRSRLARGRTERWLAEVVGQVRAGRLDPPEGVAHALHRHPGCRTKLRAGGDGYPELCVQEVRRFYPFFPVVAAQARRDFEWKGYRFPKGRRVVLDLHGINHDSRTWEAPEEFLPERFRRWGESSFDFVPQGGGDHYLGHRCAGEWITIALLKVASRFLAARMTYDVPDPDPQIDRSRLPALLRRRFVISNVRIYV